jgi:hypothetical protein
MMSLEDLADRGVIVTDEQADFFHHPYERLAVVLHGVRDPESDQSTDTYWETWYQHAWPNTPSNQEGRQAVQIPVVIEGGDQEMLAGDFASWEGDLASPWPVVFCTPCVDLAPIIGDSDILPVAVWDLWPIETHEKDLWGSAAIHALENSRIQQYFWLWDNHSNGTEPELSHRGLEDEDFQLLERLRNLEREYQGYEAQDQELAEIFTRREEIREMQGSHGRSLMDQWSQEIVHPLTGNPDAQLAPVSLPLEQATVWSSLQQLSWRNWTVLAKQSPGEGNDPYGGRFVEANRRLSPWY